MAWFSVSFYLVHVGKSVYVQVFGILELNVFP